MRKGGSSIGVVQIMDNLRGLVGIRRINIDQTAWFRDLCVLKRGWIEGWLKVLSGSLATLKERKIESS